MITIIIKNVVSMHAFKQLGIEMPHSHHGGLLGYTTPPIHGSFLRRFLLPRRLWSPASP